MQHEQDVVQTFSQNACGCFLDGIIRINSSKVKKKKELPELELWSYVKFSMGFFSKRIKNKYEKKTLDGLAICPLPLCEKEQPGHSKQLNISICVNQMS